MPNSKAHSYSPSAFFHWSFKKTNYRVFEEDKRKIRLSIHKIDVLWNMKAKKITEKKLTKIE